MTLIQYGESVMDRSPIDRLAICKAEIAEVSDWLAKPANKLSKHYKATEELLRELNNELPNLMLMADAWLVENGCDWNTTDDM